MIWCVWPEQLFGEHVCVRAVWKGGGWQGAVRTALISWASRPSRLYMINIQTSSAVGRASSCWHYVTSDIRRQKSISQPGCCLQSCWCEIDRLNTCFSSQTLSNVHSTIFVLHCRSLRLYIIIVYSYITVFKYLHCHQSVAN